MRNLSIVTVGFLVLFAAVALRCSEPEQQPAPPEQSRAIDSDAISRFAADYMEEKKIPGMAAAIVADGAVVWAAGWGWSDIAAGRPMTADTIINIASITKTVTNAAILQLRDEGRFDLDDPVNDYLPFEVVHPGHPTTPITFRHLLTHTAALGDGDAYDASYACGDPQVSLADWLEGYFTPGGPYYDAEQNFLDHEPGEKYVKQILTKIKG